MALNPNSETPLYRQLFQQIAEEIRSGQRLRGDRLPATRELAGQLGLNRTTISAAYELLEEKGLIAGQVGRGSFVTGASAARIGAAAGVNWSAMLERGDMLAIPNATVGREISFLVSRPSSDLFPLDDFRASCEAVLRRSDLADILQLGSPSGYEPLRRHLLDEARRQELAAPGDELIVTNGCQQALDLLARVLLRPGDTVLVEDPVYPGLRNVLAGVGAQLAGVPVGPGGIEVAQLDRVLERERPRMIVVTSNFQNPTGATLSEASRLALAQAARAKGVPVVENDAYGELRYEGEPVAAIKRLDEQGGTVLLRSFSKISFPGLRVGWALGPRPLIERMRQAKAASDLHTDQLSQAVLLEFAESGRLASHRARMLEAGSERLRATLDACAEFLPAGSRWTKPLGGMNVWVRLPEPLDAAQILPRAREAGVAYLPGRYFAVSRQEAGALRLSFAGLPPEEIRRGIAMLGRVVREDMEAGARSSEMAPAVV
jgi:2-aminoadipate transaminase